jgi:hypothetical protein
MTIYQINEHEFLMYTLGDQGLATIELTDEEYADYLDVWEKWNAWQDRLDDVFEARHEH